MLKRDDKRCVISGARILSFRDDNNGEERGKASHVISKASLVNGKAPEIMELLDNNPLSVRAMITLTNTWDYFWDKGYISADPNDRSTLVVCCKEFDEKVLPSKFLRIPEDLEDWPPVEVFKWHNEESRRKHSDDYCIKNCRSRIEEHLNQLTVK